MLRIVEWVRCVRHHEVVRCRKAAPVVEGCEGRLLLSGGVGGTITLFAVSAEYSVTNDVGVAENMELLLG